MHSFNEFISDLLTNESKYLSLKITAIKQYLNESN